VGYAKDAERLFANFLASRASGGPPEKSRHRSSIPILVSGAARSSIGLSTPVGILALPLLGTFDSAPRSLWKALTADRRQGASIAIIDITRIPTVDTLVAQHLLKTVAPVV
jgi:rsbT co-antagonist protein RsbR